MSKRIFKNILCTAVLAVVLAVSLTVLVSYKSYETSARKALRQEAESILTAMPLLEDENEYLSRLGTDSRITLVEADGTVTFDNMADASVMENHADRPEIAEAMRNGWSESTRTSDTLSKVTLYDARRMADGRILRVASTRDSIVAAFADALLPTFGALALVTLLSFMMARGAAKRIVAPINTLNLEWPLENDAYDELAPLLSRMEKQRLELARHMHDLESAHAELSAIMANMREGMILLDAKGRVLSINDSARSIFHLSGRDYIGQNLMAVSLDAELLALMQAALEGACGSIETTRDRRHYRLCVSPVKKNNKVCGAVVLVLDISEHFAAEESRREFTANVSHELKTPLTSISGFAEIIRDGIAKHEDVPRFAGMICKEASRLIALVNDILELAQLDEKQNLGQAEPVALLPMLQSLGEDFSPAAKQKGLALLIKGDDAKIQGHPTLLRELFFNLLDNAIKYTTDGGHITATIAQDEQGVHCAVEDTGIGIPEEHQAHIFERFYCVDKSHSRATGGTGLGLAIVKHVAQIHHAALSLESAPGHGTRIEVTFPTNV